MKLATTAFVLASLATPAFADDKAAAETAFRAAKELERQGKLAEACPLYDASYRADPALGALLNVANCHEQIGRTATAWAELHEAIELANRRGDPRVEFARKRLAALEPRLVRIHVVAPAGVTVQRDGSDVTAFVGQAVVVDPGTYRVRATAAQRIAWETSVALQREGETVRVEIPALEMIAEATPVVVVAPVSPVVDAPAPRARLPAPSSSSSSSRRTVAFVIGGTGIAAAIVGAGFGFHARSQWQASRESTSCDDHNVCNTVGSAQIDSARSSARLSTWMVSAGAALVVTAGVVWLTAPRARETRRVTVVPAIDRRELGVAAVARF